MNPASSTHEQLTYSMKWAENVVSALHRKHPRATEKLEEILATDDKSLAKYLARSDPIWPKLRDMVKIMSNWEKCANFPGWTPGMMCSLRLTLERRMPKRVLDRLDYVGICTRIKKQGS